ncbi:MULTISPECIES: type II toxin-antitoxin system Phd/YefM family antitoxin [unclassified Pseudoalteromonas]|jgi:antitoxin StbD|uniref:type II toxin-antitoxin system Phd/YefM family antitoxin n=1 Tax=unclassified Pseudoalteromonas TaxID=194690 RepID=UPI0005A66E62|nr:MULTISPECIES: type II toxin-antitoxin system Phd/YefM family antitoxin [unclassified Pseudoalteromonas]
MRQVLADCSASISELKKNPTALLNEADGSAIAILNHNKPAAYLVPAETYEWLMDVVDDYELAKVVEDRRGDLSDAIEVNLDDL